MEVQNSFVFKLQKSSTKKLINLSQKQGQIPCIISCINVDLPTLNYSSHDIKRSDVYQYFFPFIYAIANQIIDIIIQMIQNQSNHESIADFLSIPSPNQYNSLQNSSNQSSEEKNGKWSEIQHAKYIVFMEFHRKEFKSKEQRRTHKFYKKMAAFLKTRNALQCRSHHQKLQDRYCYANKIILAFKQHSNMSLYDEALNQLKVYEKPKMSNPSSQLQQSNINVQVQSQTQLCGVNAQYVYVNTFAENASDLWQYSSILNSSSANQYPPANYNASNEGFYYPYYQYTYYNNFI